MAKMIWLDMDGTIANLYKGGWLEDILNGNPRPYKVADRLVEEEKLLALIENGYELGIISWLAKGSNKEFDKKVRLAKRNWLKENYPNVRFAHINIVKYGYPKQYIKGAKGQILVDDEKPNRDKWIGQAYHPNEFFK